MGCEFRRVIGMYGRILAAIDGSPASADTIGQAVRLARELDADLYTISVQEWPTPLEVIGREVELPQALQDEFFVPVVIVEAEQNRGPLPPIALLCAVRCVGSPSH